MKGTVFDENGCPIDCPCLEEYTNCYCMEIQKDHDENEADLGGTDMSEKEYLVQLRVKVDVDILKEHGGEVSQMILGTTEDVPFCFDIEDCREVSI